MNSLPIRVRLTLWYFAMFASAGVLLCIASLWMLQKSVDETEFHDLQERADDAQVVLNHEDPRRSLQQLNQDLASIYNLKDDGKYLQVRDQDGNWIFRSKRMIAENPELPAPERLPKAGQIVEFHQGIHQVRTLAYPILVRGKRYAVQTGITLDKSIVLLSRFRTNLLLLTPIVIILAAAGGHAMSRKALMPVAALASEARRINDRNLDIRLPVPRARDEISDLSQTLNQMLGRIDRAFASVRAFTGNASHELRTPITLLRTELEVALHRPRTADEYRTTLVQLHEQTVRMTRLVENLLSLARADGGSEIIALAPFQLSVLLRHIEESWRTGMNQALVDFQVKVPDEDTFVLGDQSSIERLLSILLENASKYTPTGGSITLSTLADESKVVFSVLDTGIGISPEHKQRIFDRFFRVVSDRHSSLNGSGLGLALAKWIAERHATELIVESAPGHGSCFSFSLNRVEPIAPGIHIFTSSLAC